MNNSGSSCGGSSGMHSSGSSGFYIWDSEYRSLDCDTQSSLVYYNDYTANNEMDVLWSTNSAP